MERVRRESGLRPLSCQDRDAPHTRLGLRGCSAQSAFHRPDARHCCRAERPRASGFGSRTVAQHPCHPKRAGLPCHAERPIRTIQRAVNRPCGSWRQRWKGVSHRLLQPTYSTSTGATARFLRRRASRDTHDAGGGSVDAAPPASAALPTLSSRIAWRGAPHRSDASLRGCCRPLATLEARPLTPLSPSERARTGECQSRRALVKDHVASSPRRLPSTDAPFACLRCAGDPPPYPGLSRRRAGFQHLASTLSRETFSLPRHPGFVTPKPGR